MLEKLQLLRSKGVKERQAVLVTHEIEGALEQKDGGLRKNTLHLLVRDILGTNDAVSERAVDLLSAGDLLHPDVLVDVHHVLGENIRAYRLSGFDDQWSKNVQPGEAEPVRLDNLHHESVKVIVVHVLKDHVRFSDGFWVVPIFVVQFLVFVGCREDGVKYTGSALVNGNDGRAFGVYRRNRRRLV